MPLDMGSVNNTLSKASGSIEGQIKSELDAAQGGELNETQLMNLQIKMSKWTLITSLQSNVIKALSDGMKSTIQNVH